MHQREELFYRTHANAIDCNNAGVMYLSKGDLVNAQTAFRRAITHLSLPSDSSINTNPQTQYGRSEVARPQSPQERRIERCYQVPGGSIVYSRGICIPNKLKDYTKDTNDDFCEDYEMDEYDDDDETIFPSHLGLDDRSICYAIVMYNQALTCHLFGMMEQCHSPTRRQAFQKAQELYEFCQRILFSGPCACDILSYDPVVDFLCLSMMNNHTHVCFDLTDYRKVDKSSDMLTRIISSIKPDIYIECDDSESLMRIIQAMDDFRWNEQYLLRGPSSASAA